MRKLNVTWTEEMVRDIYNARPFDYDAADIEIEKLIEEMIKLNYRTRGQDPDINCTISCRYKHKPSKGTMIGSASCQGCESCYGWDKEEQWVKCLNYACEQQGLYVELDNNTIRKEKLDKLYTQDELD